VKLPCVCTVGSKPSCQGISANKVDLSGKPSKKFSHGGMLQFASSLNRFCIRYLGEIVNPRG
jgi:hypothetical protein